jgi:hypothetical protein
LLRQNPGVAELRTDRAGIASSLSAVHAIGDDTLRKATGRRPFMAAFAHGSSAQRMQSLRDGHASGNKDDCDTFADLKTWRTGEADERKLRAKGGLQKCGNWRTRLRLLQ